MMKLIFFSLKKYEKYLYIWDRYSKKFYLEL